MKLLQILMVKCTLSSSALCIVFIWGQAKDAILMSQLQEILLNSRQHLARDLARTGEVPVPRCSDIPAQSPVCLTSASCSRLE